MQDEPLVFVAAGRKAASVATQGCASVPVKVASYEPGFPATESIVRFPWQVSRGVKPASVMTSPCTPWPKRSTPATDVFTVPEVMAVPDPEDEAALERPETPAYS
jgi:hypothetical protein